MNGIKEYWIKAIKEEKKGRGLEKEREFADMEWEGHYHCTKLYLYDDRQLTLTLLLKHEVIDCCMSTLFLADNTFFRCSSKALFRC